MIIGVLKEQSQHRVAIVPKTAKKFQGFNCEVWAEDKAGERAFFPNAMYEAAGVKITNRSEILTKADIIICIVPPSEVDLKTIKSKGIIVSMFQPYNDKSIVATLSKMDIIPFSMDMIPRSTLAQAMDILSSMASIAGYRAAIIGASHLPHYYPMMITAAGSIRPSTVLVLGAGVAGLQAIATAKRLGAVVEAFDVRTAVKEEVESLGAKFIQVEGSKDDKGAGGYAVEQTEDYKKRQAQLIHERALKAGVVITTAQLRGRPAPELIKKETVEQMKKGAVIIDLAASTGGNCKLSKNGKTIVHKGITIVGDSNLADKMPNDASTLFSNNVFNFLKLIITKEGELTIDTSNEIVRSAYFTYT